MACRLSRPCAAPNRTTARLSPAIVEASARRGPLHRSCAASAPPQASAVCAYGVDGRMAAAHATRRRCP
eukprot:11085530-Alexandrium_andersonii.AAC.1